MPLDRSNNISRGGPRRGDPEREDDAAPIAAGDPINALGVEIRRLRKAKGLTLTGLAGRTGLSTGYISQAERGKSVLSIKALKDISDALGVKIGWFFQEGEPAKHEERGIVVRAKHRRKVSYGGLGVTDYLLSPNLSGDIELLLSTFAPGAGSGDEPYTHEGEEAGLILLGSLELWVEDRHFLLKKGDSFTFRSTRPHRYRNPGRTETMVVWAITPPSF